MVDTADALADDAPSKTGRGGKYPEAVVKPNPEIRRVASDFVEEVDGRTKRESPWTQVLVDLVGMINTRDGEGNRLLGLGEFLKIGHFTSKYGARNRASKMADGNWKHVPEVDGYHFVFKTVTHKYTTGQGGGHWSELWAALVADEDATAEGASTTETVDGDQTGDDS